MKEMFAISSSVDVVKSKSMDISAKNNTQTQDNSSSNDFYSIMSKKINESSKQKEDTKSNVQSSSNSSQSEEIKTDDSKKSVDDHLLDDLLKVTAFLQNQTNETDSINTTFPSLSNRLTKVMNNETAVNDLKNVKNITDLLDVSKKYDLGLEKISVEKLDLNTLKGNFSSLNKKFFELPKEQNEKSTTTSTNTNVSNIKKEPVAQSTILTMNNIDKSTQTVKSEPSLLEKFMSSTKSTEKNNLETVLANTKTLKVNESANTVKSVQEQIPKVLIKDTQNENLKSKIDNEIKTLSTSKNTTVEALQADNTSKSMVENILQNMKTKNQTSSTLETLLSSNDSKKDFKTTDSIDTKSEAPITRDEFKTPIKTDTIASKQLSSSKQSLNNFATDFKEQVDNYKSPITKVQMSLNPKGLGDVDVTIVNRGNNLHVNINSNASTMSLFTQNQAEFKNSLVNMGFTNLEMNFSDQRDNQGQQNNNSSNQSNRNYDDENYEEENTNIELVIPQYI